MVGHRVLAVCVVGHRSLCGRSSSPCSHRVSHVGSIGNIDHDVHTLYRSHVPHHEERQVGLDVPARALLQGKIRRGSGFGFASEACHAKDG